MKCTCICFYRKAVQIMVISMSSSHKHNQGQEIMKQIHTKLKEDKKRPCNLHVDVFTLKEFKTSYLLLYKNATQQVSGKTRPDIGRTRDILFTP